MKTLALAALLAVAPAALAHGPGSADGQEAVNILQRKTLADAPGKETLFFTVEYAPGQQSVPHVHGGSVIAYVLEGAVTSQLEGEAPVTYRAGQSWFEAPRIGHLVSKNASATKPAKLLVWILGAEGAPVLTPLQAGISRKDLVQSPLSVPAHDVVQVRVGFAPHAAAARHSHPGEEVAHVLEGRIEYQIDGQAPVVLDTGESLFIPAGAVHKARNVGDTEAAELATYIVERDKPLVVPAAP